MVKRYVPERGDIVWLDFAPHSGHEQTGRRPALVLSPRGYNEKVGLALFSPVTSKIKNYPFEVPLPKKCAVNGVILADQIKSLDWRTRHAAFVCKAPADVTEEARQKVLVLLE